MSKMNLSKMSKRKKYSYGTLLAVAALVGSVASGVTSAAGPLQGTGLILGDQEGHKNTAQATYKDQVSTAIGFDNVAINNGTSIGYNNNSNTSAVAIGHDNIAHDSGTAIGNDSIAIGGISIGSKAKTGISNLSTSPTHPDKYYTSRNSIALGNESSSMSGTAVGYKSQTNEYGLAIGEEAKALYGGDAFGNSARTERAQFSLMRQEGVALGNNSVADRGFGSIGYVPLSENNPSSLENSMARDLALAEQTGNAKTQEVVKAFYDTYGAQYEEYEKTYKEYEDNYVAVYEQREKMNRTTYATEEARQKDLAVLTEREAAVKASIEKIKELEKTGINRALIKKDNYLGTWKATGGAVSVGRAAQYDANGDQIVGPITRQITNVAAGTEDTDAVNVAQLKAVEKTTADKVSSFTVGNGKKAAEDEEAPASITVDNENTHFDIMGVNSNITTEVDQNGRAIKVGLANTLNLGSNGSISFGDNGTKLDGNGLTIVNGPSITNKGINAGGQTITNVGNGSIKPDSKEAVTGGQIYEEIQKITGENGALNGKADSNLSNITEAGKTVINKISTEAAQKAVTVSNGDSFVKVELNKEQKEKGVNQYDVSLNKDTLRDALGTGKNEAGNKDLITGDTLHQVISNVVAGQASDEHITNLAQKAIDIKDGENTTVTSKTEDGVKTYQVNVSDEAIKTAVKPELDQKANLDGSNLTPDAITNWKDQLGVTNVTNEVSGLNNRVDGLESNVSNLNNRVNKLDQRVDKVGAGAAALAGLHPLEFNPDDKFSAAVAMGSYKGQGAAALGGFYRPNADTMFSVSSTLGDETMFNIGLSLKFGDKGDDIYRNPNNTSFRELTNEVASLKEQNKALNDKMAEKEKSFEATNKALNDKVSAQQAELEQQRALIQQLMAKVGM